MESTYSNLQKSKTLILKNFRSSDAAIEALLETGLAYQESPMAKNYVLCTGIRIKPDNFSTPYRLQRGHKGSLREWQDLFKFVRKADKLVS